MTILSTASRDMLYSLSWYMAARKTSLRAALSYRTQLSITDQLDMRVHYSGYFLNLLAATELLHETKTLQPNDFLTQLYAHLVFDGFENGEANYSYIRELRNAVVHRGLDVTSAAHIDGNFPMILAEPKVNNQSGKKTFVAFDKYLINVIEKCESVVGSVMHDCLTRAGIFEATIDPQLAAAECHGSVEQSHAIPDQIKAMSLAMEFKPEFATAAHSSAMMKLREALEPCETSRSSAA